MNQCHEMAIDEGFWKCSQCSPWTVKSTLEGKQGFEGEMLCQNGLQQSRCSLSILRISDLGKDKSTKDIYSNPLTKSSYLSSAPRILPSDTAAQFCMGFGI